VKTGCWKVIDNEGSWRRFSHLKAGVANPLSIGNHHQLVCTTPYSGAKRRCPVQPSTPLGPDQVNVLLLLATINAQGIQLTREGNEGVGCFRLSCASQVSHRILGKIRAQQPTPAGAISLRLPKPLRLLWAYYSILTNEPTRYPVRNGQSRMIRKGHDEYDGEGSGCSDLRSLGAPRRWNKAVQICKQLLTEPSHYRSIL
jgi:hypothetical protein